MIGVVGWSLSTPLDPRKGADLAGFVAALADGPPSDDSTGVLFTVAKGATASAIARDLEEAGLVRSAMAFRLQAELRRAAGRLAEGRYELRRNMRAGEILDVLAAGQTLPTRLITIPEGWRAEEIALHLEANGLVKAEPFLDLVAGRVAVEDLPLPKGANSFEGYLFPDSYDFGYEPTPETVLRTLVGQFEQKAGGVVPRRAGERDLSTHELVTLASIIEREAVQPDERPVISAVFHNRLARGMALQADPTTQYALVPFGTLAPDGSFWKQRLAPRDLDAASPFNTYRITGLPPGPICNPGVASIEAAAAPADHEWLYFVARPDGSHVFARTLDEHLANIAQIAREESGSRL